MKLANAERLPALLNDASVTMQRFGRVAKRQSKEQSVGKVLVWAWYAISSKGRYRLSIDPYSNMWCSYKRY